LNASRGNPKSVAAAEVLASVSNLAADSIVAARDDRRTPSMLIDAAPHLPEQRSGLDPRAHYGARGVLTHLATTGPATIYDWEYVPG